MLANIDTVLIDVKLATIPTIIIFTFSLLSFYSKREDMKDKMPPPIKVSKKKKRASSRPIVPLAIAWQRAAAAAKTT